MKRLTHEVVSSRDDKIRTCRPCIFGTPIMAKNVVYHVSFPFSALHPSHSAPFFAPFSAEDRLPVHLPGKGKTDLNFV